MKKAILIIAIAFLGFAAIGQDTVKTDFDFSIDLLVDTVSRSNGSKVTHNVSVLPVMFTPNQAVFNYVIKTYNITNPDTAIFVGKKREQAVLTVDELNVVLQGERVWKWLEYLYGKEKPPVPPQTIIRVIGEKVYYHKVEGGN